MKTADNQARISGEASKDISGGKHRKSQVKWRLPSLCEKNVDRDCRRPSATLIIRNCCLWSLRNMVRFL